METTPQPLTLEFFSLLGILALLVGIPAVFFGLAIGVSWLATFGFWVCFFGLVVLFCTNSTFRWFVLGMFLISRL